MEGLHHWLQTIHRTERFSAAPRRAGEETVGASGRVRQVNPRAPAAQDDNFPPGARLADPIPLFRGGQARFSGGWKESITHCCSLSGASALGKQGAMGKPVGSPEKPRFITSLRNRTGLVRASPWHVRHRDEQFALVDVRQSRTGPAWHPAALRYRICVSRFVSCRATLQIEHQIAYRRTGPPGPCVRCPPVPYLENPCPAPLATFQQRRTRDV